MSMLHSNHLERIRPASSHVYSTPVPREHGSGMVWLRWTAPWLPSVASSWNIWLGGRMRFLFSYQMYAGMTLKILRIHACWKSISPLCYQSYAKTRELTSCIRLLHLKSFSFGHPGDTWWMMENQQGVKCGGAVIALKRRLMWWIGHVKNHLVKFSSVVKQIGQNFIRKKISEWVPDMCTEFEIQTSC